MSTLHRAILWRWPGAQCVTSDEQLIRWDGPMARPTAAELAQARRDYTAGVEKDDQQEQAFAAAHKVMIALAKTCHARLAVLDPSLTWTAFRAEWKQRFKAED